MSNHIGLLVCRVCSGFIKNSCAQDALYALYLGLDALKLEASGTPSIGLRPQVVSGGRPRSTKKPQVVVELETLDTMFWCIQTQNSAYYAHDQLGRADVQCRGRSGTIQCHCNGTDFTKHAPICETSAVLTPRSPIVFKFGAFCSCL
jgi:hypothetical protein